VCSVPAPSCVTTCITCCSWKAPSSTRSTARMCDTGMEERTWGEAMEALGPRTSDPGHLRSVCLSFGVPAVLPHAK
jgi:hypothetical protein